MIYRFGQFELDASARELRAGGVRIDTEPRAFDLLAYLAEHRDRAVSKDELLEALWPRQIVTETALTRAVMKARRAVGDDSERQDVIRTVHGHGYRFVASLAPEPPPESMNVAKAGEETAAWWRRWPAVAIAALLLVASALVVLNREDAPVPDSGALAVLPVSNQVGDPELDWVRLGLMSLLQRMLEEGGVEVVADRRVLEAVGDAALAEPPDSELVESIRHRTGAGSVFYTTLDRQGGLLRLSTVLAHPDGRKSRRVIVGESPATLAADMANVVAQLLTGNEVRVGDRFSRISTDPFVNELYARALDLELQGQLDRARQLFRLAAEQEPGLFWLRYEIALCTRDLREWDEAEQLFAELQEEAEAGTDERALIVTANSRGVMEFNRNRYDAAESLFHTALAAAGSAEFALERASTLVNLGLIAGRRGQLDAAAGFYDQALDAVASAGEDPAPEFLNNYAGLLLRQGELERARAFSEQAVEGFRVRGHRRFEAPSLNRLARILRRLGDLDGAVQRHEQAIVIYAELGNEIGELSARGALTSVYLARGDLSRADANAREVLERAAGTGDELLIGDAAINMAEVDTALLRHEQALAHYESAHEIFAAVGDEPGAAAALTGIAKAALALGDTGRAQSLASAMLAAAEEARQARAIARARHLNGEVAAASGDLANAMEHFAFALAYGRERQDASVLASAAARMAALELDRGNFTAAVSLLDEARPHAADDRDFLRLDARLAVALGDHKRAADILVNLRQSAGESWLESDAAMLETVRD